MDIVLATRGFNPIYGARPLKRAIQKLVEDPISEMLLGGTLQSGCTLKMDSLNQKDLVFSTES